MGARTSGISRLFGAAKLQSALGADNQHYAALITGLPRLPSIVESISHRHRDLSGHVVRL